MPHAASRLSTCWGPSSLEALKASVAEIALEYLIGAGEESPSGAAHVMAELGTPRYSHELIKRVFVIALDHKEREMKRARELIGYLSSLEDPLMQEQVRKGLGRIQDELDDLRVDAPNASKEYEVLLEFLKSSK